MTARSSVVFHLIIYGGIMFKKLSILITLSLVMTLIFTAVAFADDVANDADASVDAAFESVSLNIGGNRTVDLYIVERNSDGKNGCNLTGSTTLVINATSSNISVATVSPLQITFTNCEGVNTNMATAVTVTAISAGTANIEFSLESNTTEGTFNLLTARFTVNVTAPATATPTPPENTAPSVSVTGVTHGASYEFGSVPPAGCAVVDDEDGNFSFPAALSSITGPLAAYGLGSQTASCSYTDGGGLTASASATYSIVDITPPVITPNIVGTSGSNGWYVSDVTLSWSVSDDQSSISSSTDCDASTINEETPGQTFTCSATSAGGTSSQSVTIKLDKSAPSAALAVTVGTLSLNDWYTSDVTVSTSGSDDISGPVTCSADQTQTDETTGTVFNGACTNGAGLTTDATPLTVKLDKTGPSAALAVTAGTLGLNDWYTSDVTVSTTGSDSISGEVTCTADQTQTDETTGTVFNGACTNGAGLKTVAEPLIVKLDKTEPLAELAVTVGTPGLNGWYTSNVTVSTSGSDGISGPVTCSADQTQTDETTGTVFNGACTNGAGLTGNADPLTVKLDKDAPTITWVGGPVHGGNYYYSFVPPAPTCTAADTISGPNGCNVTGYGTAIGSHTMTATGYDLAGNMQTVTKTYTVLGWTPKGFYQPVDMPEVYNTVKNGSTVPFKFELFAGETELTSTFAVVGFTAAAIPCPKTGVIADAIEVLTTGGTSLRYDTIAGQYVFNWQTPKKIGTCYRITVTAQDGSSLSALFMLK